MPPACWAQATPPMTVRPASMVESGRGVSIRLDVLIGASIAQSRSVQYASCSAYVVSVIRVIHLVALTKP